MITAATMEWQRLCSRSTHWHVLRTSQGLQSLHSTLILILPALPQKLQQKQCITNVYCNNQGIIDHSNQKTMCPYPRDTISDDYPIYAEIIQTTTRLKPTDIQLHHVKGHQDTKTDWPLMLPEKLNIECDARLKNGSCQGPPYSINSSKNTGIIPTPQDQRANSNTTTPTYLTRCLAHTRWLLLVPMQQVQLDPSTRPAHPLANIPTCFNQIQPNRKKVSHKVHPWMASATRLVSHEKSLCWPNMPILPGSKRNCTSI